MTSIPDHLLRDGRELLRTPVAIAAAAGLVLAIVTGTWRALLPLWVQGAMIFGLLATVFYSDRYSLPLAPIYLALLGAAAAGAPRSRSPGWLLPVLCLVPLGFSVRETIAQQRFVRQQLPIEVRPAAAALRAASAGEADPAVIARKAAVAYYAGARSVAFPRLQTLGELARYAGENRAGYLYFSWYEGALRPEFWFLVDSTAAVPGLEKVFATNDNASVLYRIRPGFGIAPAWYENDTLKKLHDLRGYVRMVREADAYPLHRSLGASAARDGNWSVAADHFRAMTVGRPGEVEAWLMLGDVELERERFAAAHEAFTHALSLQTTNATAQLGRGMSELGMGRPDAAATTLRPVLARIQDPVILARLDSVYARRGETSARQEIEGLLDGGAR